MKKYILSVMMLAATITIAFSQNVGIGTNTPTDKLSVVNALPGYGITHSYGPVTMGTYISNLYGQFGTKTNHPLQFFTNNGNAQLTLLQNGNFGINTALPTQSLDVVGSILTEGVTAGLRFNDQSDNNNGYEWYSSAGNAYLFRSHLPIGNPITVLSNGNIGFNKVTPQTDLHIDPAGPGSILIGTNKNSGGYTAIEMGINAQTGGKGYIQTTRASGSSYGDMYLNPNGGYVGVNMPVSSTLFAPLDINQSSSVRGIRLRNPGITQYSQNTWDIYVDYTLNFNSTGFHVAFIGGDGTWNQVSDARLKTGVVKMESVLEKVMVLQPKKYKYINNNPKENVSSGFLAQEVIPIFPELVTDFQHPTSDTTDTAIYHGINYAGFSVIAIKAIQEQQQQIQTQQQTIDTQNKRLVDFQKRLEALEGKK